LPPAHEATAAFEAVERSANRNHELELAEMFLSGGRLFPSLAHAHSSRVSLNGWDDGFNHPLHGWDHLLVMLAVGIWAAQQWGRAV